MAPLHHPNLVILHGGCWTDGPDKLAIVLEFCGGGSLEGLLNNSSKSEEAGAFCSHTEFLEHLWAGTFYGIVVGIVRCFVYLHFGVSGGLLIHRDLKVS